jgi:hypothetical protein
LDTFLGAGQRPNTRCDRAADCEHNRVERLISQLTPFRRVAIRHEKLAVTYLAMVTHATILMRRHS